ncbi:hypothetical protein [Flavisolibacter ginsenosidimutans]|uniref:Gliding motility-associated protein GldM N-terminal domain-containing protein n=1 Tax=Flavisolibacter ginsenosidimutans TaxID=661481 RepID=A0A5B8UJ05_9BACT|nr:hypothetical protein [Flavisolibacter ginsenosidimutans]QEC56376.1 hypothetical protein FSB75_10900 [Flavisolibacter ginsenosidimutans]
MKTLPLLTLTFLFGCNSVSEHIEQQVDSNIETAKQDMNAEIEKSKEEFREAYQLAEKSNSDKFGLQNLQTFKTTFTSTDNYLDSLKTEMDGLNDKDVHTVELVKSIFLYKGAGDSIINKLNRTIAIGKAVARTEKQKVAIKAMNDSLGIAPNPDRWKEQTFGLTGPLGASMVLYGLRTELYAIGMKTLTDW